MNQEMQTDSIRASFGLSRGFPNNGRGERIELFKEVKKTSKVGVLEGVHCVQAHPHCGDDHKHHAGEIVDSSDRLYPVGNIHFVFV